MSSFVCIFGLTLSLFIDSLGIMVELSIVATVSSWYDLEAINKFFNYNYYYNYYYNYCAFFSIPR